MYRHRTSSHRPPPIGVLEINKADQAFGLAFSELKQQSPIDTDMMVHVPNAAAVSGTSNVSQHDGCNHLGLQ